MSGSGYIKSLDGLRAMAIILVLSLHTGVMHFGWVGVQLFFVLSGFLITGILWKEKGREEPISYKFKKFWVRRALRILPLYFGYLFVLSLTYLLFHFPDSFRTYMPYLLTYTYNFTRTLPGWKIDPAFAHLWSLAIEEQFYLFFPLILLLAPKRFVRIFMGVIIVITPITRWALGQYFIHKGFKGEALATIVYWNSFSHLDAFFIGGMIPVLSLNKHIKKPWFFLTAGLILVLSAGIWNFANHVDRSFYLTDFGYSFGQTSNYAYVWQYSVLNLFFASIILVLVSEHVQRFSFPLRRILENRWLVNIGKVSYGMYIYHWIIWFYLFENFFKPEKYLSRLPLFIPYLIIVYFVSAFSFRFFEAYFIKLKDRFYPSAGLAGKGSNKPNLKTPLGYE